MRLPHPHPVCWPDPLESLESLLTRIKRDNHYEEANWLETLVPLPVPGNLNLWEQSDHFARLSELTELPENFLWHETAGGLG